MPVNARIIQSLTGESDYTCYFMITPSHAARLGIMTLLVVSLVSCNGSLSVNDVKKLNRYTARNGNLYQYVSIPDSASLPELIEVTRELVKRSGRESQQNLFNYYIGSERVQKYAVLVTHKVADGTDTVAVVQYPGMKDTPAAVFEKSALEVLTADPHNRLPDSCAGVWFNWSNPFEVYLIVYKDGGNLRVQSYHPSLGQNDVAIPDKNALGNHVLRTDSRQSKDWGVTYFDVTKRYERLQYNDLYVTEQTTDDAEYMLGVYNFLCDCPKQQPWPLPLNNN